MSIFSRNAEAPSDFVTREDYTRLIGEFETLEESYADLALKIEDIGWTRLTALSGDNGFTLNELQTIAKPLAEMVEFNSLLKRGADLRHAYVHGEGYSLREVERAKSVINRQSNQDAFFSIGASKARIKARMSDGNIFILRNRASNELIHVPFGEIAGIITDDMDASKVLYVKRRWSNGAGQPIERWFKTSTNSRKSNPTGLFANTPLNGEWVMYHRAYNRQAGFALGVPDALAAMQWAEAYTEYLKNNSKLVRAYARIAAKVTPATKSAAADAAVKIDNAGSTDTFGMTAILGGNLQHLPATGSSVDFNNGRAMAALVAAVLGVSSDALLSGTVGATKSVSDMLDLATSSVMKVVQAEEKALMEMILHDMGAPKAEVDFPTMDTDPVYRELQSLAQAYATGGISQSEYRERVIDLLDIKNPDKELPKPDAFNTGHVPGDEVPDPIPSQGNSGATGEGIGTNNDARDNSEYED